jgi:protein gp37
MSEKFWDKGIQLVGGCTKVSAGCKNCWSEVAHARFHKGGAPCYKGTITDGKFNGNVTFNLHLLEKSAKVRKPQVYAIWNDLYHEGLLTAEITKALGVMSGAKLHTFLIITKRPERAEKINRFYKHESEWCDIPYPDNIWHIVTAENQSMADKRIPHLLNIPGKRGVIVEPMLGPVSIGRAMCRTCDAVGACEADAAQEDTCYQRIGQIILGPENGVGKRQFEEGWAENMENECEAAGVPYYRKDKDMGTLAWR